MLKIVLILFNEKYWISTDNALGNTSQLVGTRRGQRSVAISRA